MARFYPFLLCKLAIAGAVVFALAGPGAAKRQKLPPEAPLPEASPQATTEPSPGEPPVVPVPAPRPADGTSSPEHDTELAPGDAGQKDGEPPAEAALKPRPTDPRSMILPERTLPPGEGACRTRLTALDVEYRDGEAEHDSEVGCSIPYPVIISTLGPSIALDPPAELNCAMAEAAARFTAKTIEPTAKSELGSDVKSIAQASAFVCRPRHNGEKLSEHAFGNALDIASFTLSDGTTVEIGPAPTGKPARFLTKVRAAACGPFKTVLGPGSDPDHELHFHLDLEPRRNGGTFCQ